MEDIFICYDKNLYNVLIKFLFETMGGYVYYHAFLRNCTDFSTVCKYHLFSYEHVIFQWHKLSKDSCQVFFTVCVCIQVHTFYVHRQVIQRGGFWQKVNT